MRGFVFFFLQKFTTLAEIVNGLLVSHIIPTSGPTHSYACMQCALLITATVAVSAWPKNVL